MISCVLMGGLGNQLFQIFATIAYALENNKSFGFMYTEHLGGVGQTIKRKTYWHSFLLPLRKFTHTSLPQMPIQREKGFEYAKLDSLSEGNDIMLFGYFQSYKYFESYFQTICRVIKLDKIKVDVMSKYSYNYRSISMHFRLGDYKNIPDYHPVLEYDYYEKALEFIVSSTDKREVLYFCEEQDNEDVQKTIEKLESRFSDVNFTKASDKIEDWEQMIMMSCCKYNIIANSTFSWWAGQLNNNNYKIICYPEKWFGPKNSHLNTKDVFPAHWNAIHF
jgi:Glycosyl transferase family 11